MSKKILFLSLISLCALNAHAAENNMRPGLWEITTTSGLLSLAEQVPPDQMQNLANLAKQYGFDMPAIKNGAASSKVCITKDMAEQKIPPYASHLQSGCEARNAVRNGNRYSADLSCSGENISGQGKTTATLTSPEDFNGITEFKGLVRGMPIDERATSQGRWIAAQCSVKNIQ